MEYLVMECGLSYAVVMDQDGRILKVPNLDYTVGQSLKDVVLLPLSLIHISEPTRRSASSRMPSSA